VLATRREVGASTSVQLRHRSVGEIRIYIALFPPSCSCVGLHIVRCDAEIPPLCSDSNLASTLTLTLTLTPTPTQRHPNPHSYPHSHPHCKTSASSWRLRGIAFVCRTLGFLSMLLGGTSRGAELEHGTVTYGEMPFTHSQEGLGLSSRTDGGPTRQCRVAAALLHG
jgi:hypothetical protein